jgi:hypothetical protein
MGKAIDRGTPPLGTSGVSATASPPSYYIARRGKNETGESGFAAWWFYPGSGREERSGYWRPTREQLATTMTIMHGAVPWRGETGGRSA